jgi:hypothetical protein
MTIYFITNPMRARIDKREIRTLIGDEIVEPSIHFLVACRTGRGQSSAICGKRRVRFESIQLGTLRLRVSVVQ